VMALYKLVVLWRIPGPFSCRSYLSSTTGMYGVGLRVVRRVGGRAWCFRSEETQSKAGLWFSEASMSRNRRGDKRMRLFVGIHNCGLVVLMGVSWLV
jgi:hypothetical protein